MAQNAVFEPEMYMCPNFLTHPDTTQYPTDPTQPLPTNLRMDMTRPNWPI